MKFSRSDLSGALGIELADNGLSFEGEKEMLTCYKNQQISLRRIDRGQPGGVGEHLDKAQGNMPKLINN